jgi:hypothetical protein
MIHRYPFLFNDRRKVRLYSYFLTLFLYIIIKTIHMIVYRDRLSHYDVYLITVYKFKMYNLVVL